MNDFFNQIDNMSPSLAAACYTVAIDIIVICVLILKSPTIDKNEDTDTI